MSRSVFDRRRGASGVRPLIMYDSSPNVRHGIYPTDDLDLQFGIVGPFSSGTNRGVGTPNVYSPRAVGIGELTAYSTTFNVAAITVGAWVWPSSLFPTSGNEIFCNGRYNLSGTVDGFRMGWNRNLDQFGVSGANWGGLSSTVSPVSLNAWHHVVGTANSGGSVIYLDGTANATGGSAYTPFGSPTIQSVGNLVSGSYVDQRWVGRLAGVFVCPSVLDATTVAGIASQTTMAAYKAAVLATSPLALWMLDE